MTVVVNCRFLTRPVTGVERYAFEMVQALAEIRSDLLLVAPQTPPLQRAEIAGLRVRAVGSLSGHAWEQISLPRFLRTVDDPVLVGLANTGPMHHADQVIVVHDLMHRRHPQSHARSFRWWYGVMTPRLMRSARTVVTVSEFSRGEIRDVYGRDDVAIVPNAVGAWLTGPQQQPSSIGEMPFFLAVGSHSRHKGLDTAVEAFHRYRGSGGRTALAVVGAANRSFADDERIATADAVIELGRVSDEELAWLYHHARAFVFPSHYEGFGIPPIEAQAAGTPVIASDIPVLREVLEEGSAMRFAAGDAASLAAAMTAIDEDPVLVARLKENGRRNAERHSWAASASELSALIDQLTS